MAALGFGIGMVDSSMMPQLGYLVDIRHGNVYGNIFFLDFCFAHPIFLSVGFWYFGHFSSVILFPFFPSCPSCLVKCKQRLRNIYSVLYNFYTLVFRIKQEEILFFFGCFSLLHVLIRDFLFIKSPRH